MAHRREILSTAALKKLFLHVVCIAILAQSYLPQCNILLLFITSVGRVAQSVWRLATGWTFRDRIPVGTRFPARPDRSWGPRSLLYNGYWVFPEGKERPGRDTDPSPLLMPWSRKSSAIPLLPLWAVRPVQSLSACTRMHFTFVFLPYLITSVMTVTCVKNERDYERISSYTLYFTRPLNS